MKTLWPFGGTLKKKRKFLIRSRHTGMVGHAYTELFHEDSSFLALAIELHLGEGRLTW